VAKKALESEESQTLSRAQAVHALNLLRKDVSQVLVDEDDKLQQQWVSPFLLASFAEMFIQDKVAGARAQSCECCGKLFVTVAYQALYCGRACRLRKQKRNLRANMRQARTLYISGQSVAQISRALGEDPQNGSRLGRGPQARTEEWTFLTTGLVRTSPFWISRLVIHSTGQQRLRHLLTRTERL